MQQAEGPRLSRRRTTRYDVLLSSKGRLRETPLVLGARVAPDTEATAADANGPASRGQAGNPVPAPLSPAL